eukprot:jgi/Chlat1/8075/Chrsp75S07540
MSLFKARDWWTARCGDGSEEFHTAALCVANVDNDPSNDAKIITGSLEGMLRVFKPQQRDFRVEDLLLEVELPLPILQLAVGRFSAAAPGQHALAVLHPRRLAVFALGAVGSAASSAAAGQQASCLALTLLYEHQLERTACNMTHGPFGGAPGGVDYICVQSMDGQLMFFEHEALAFTRFLPSFVVPGPLAYCQRTDTFITFNSSFAVECYKYQVLAVSSAEQRGEPVGLNQSKRVQCDWSLILEEPALDARIGRVSSGLLANQVDIVVLTERQVLCIQENGCIRSQKRLDYSPACLCTYPRGDNGMMDNIMVGAATGSLLVYRESQLAWAAKYDAALAALAVSSFGGLRGLVVGLTDDGRLSVMYMGTDPVSQGVNAPAPTMVDNLRYEEMDAEHRRLLQQIRDVTVDGKQEPANALVLRAQVPTRLDSGTEDEPHHGTTSQATVTARLFLNYTGRDTIQNIQVAVSVPLPIACAQETFTIASLAGGQRTPAIVPIELSWASSSQGLAAPWFTSAHVAVTYVTNDGAPRTASCELHLPLALFAQSVPPVKKAGYKITLDTNRDPVDLTELFDDFVPSTSDGGGSVLSLRYRSGHDCTILVSKSAGRYRLQSSTFEALWLLSHELCHRLTAHYNAIEQSKTKKLQSFAITFEEPLPLQDYFAVVDAHFNARMAMATASKLVDDKSTQLRAIQKRLLVRFRDKTPASLTHLDLLFQGAYEQLSEAIEQLESCQRDTQQAAVRLAGGTRVMLLLLRLKCKLSDAECAVLESYLPPVLDESAEQGWEETTEAALQYLSRTVFAKHAKEGFSVQLQEPLQDTVKLKKQITNLCEKLASGASLIKQSKQ